MTVPGIVFANPGSGPQSTDLDDLRKIFPGSQVVEIDRDSFDDQIERGLATQPSFVGAAGGDGTIRSIADHLREQSEIPLVAIPAGTRNHFARALGIEDLELAGEAAKNGDRCRIDVGEVNGQCFINNSSIGVYADAVEAREKHERRLPKRVAQWLAAWEQMHSGEPFDVSVGGRQYRAWLVFVGNGAYGDDLRDIGDRRSLTEHELDIRVVRADVRLSRLRLILAIIFGRLRHTRVIVRLRCSEIEVEVPAESRTKVALDGEVDELRSPLCYRSVAEGLEVLVPPRSGEAAR